MYFFDFLRNTLNRLEQMHLSSELKNSCRVSSILLQIFTCGVCIVSVFMTEVSAFSLLFAFPCIFRVW